MSWILKAIIIGISSYLLGALPFGLMITRKIKGIDIRKFGSGNIGATNVVRVLGLKWGVLVFALDFLKGFAPVLTAFYIFRNNPNLVNIAIIFSVLPIVGHNWPVFLKFKGGKGVSTSIGALTGLGVILPGVRIAVLLSVLVWSLTFLFLRVVGIASVLGATAFFLFSLLVENVPVQIKFFSFFVWLFIVLRHIKNLKEFFCGRKR